MYKVIKNDIEYQKTLDEAEKLVEKNPVLGSGEADKLELLTLLINKYEKEHFPIRVPDPIEAILFRMEQQGIKRKDLIPFFGSASKISEVFSGKRPLSLKMIKVIHKSLGIPAEILIQESKKKRVSKKSKKVLMTST